MEESAETSGAEGEIEIVNPFEKNTFLPGDGSSEKLPKRATESSSVVEVKDPFKLSYKIHFFLSQVELKAAKLCISAPKNAAPLGKKPVSLVCINS